jgi:hypothetical protein
MVNGNLNTSIKYNTSQKYLTKIAFGIVIFVDKIPPTIFGKLNTRFNILDEF